MFLIVNFVMDMFNALLILAGFSRLFFSTRVWQVLVLILKCLNLKISFSVVQIGLKLNSYLIVCCIMEKVRTIIPSVVVLYITSSKLYTWLFHCKRLTFHARIHWPPISQVVHNSFILTQTYCTFMGLYWINAGMCYIGGNMVNRHY